MKLSYRTSWVYSGRSGFLPHGKLTGPIRTNTVKKVITIVVKINRLKADFQSSHEAPRSWLRVLASN